MWHPERPEIQDWFDQKLQEFAEVENQNPGLTTDKWLAIYIHDGPHEYFFSEFLIILYKWLVRFTYKKTNFQGGEPTSWTPELIQELQETDNKASRAIEVWMDSILEGYTTKFANSIAKSYNEAEREFFNEPRGRFLLSL